MSEVDPLSPVAPGDVLADKYEVEQVLGVGGMGIVVAARHIHLGGKVALKFLRPSALESEGVVTRFTREAQAATRIKSEHVARVTDVGKLDTGSPYMVMEFLEGCDLSQLLTQQGRLPISDSIDYVLQAMQAIGEAHSLGIVHRDLKPSNLFITKRSDDSPLIKVLDFGISKAADANSQQLTQTAGVMGSPLYMAPEQIRSTKHVDARADIWSLGVILYELLAGYSPFGGGESAGAVFAAILTEPPPSLRQTRPEVPPELENAINHCLAKNAAERFQNVAQLAAAIAPFGTAESRVSADRIGRLFAKTTRSQMQVQSPFLSTLPLAESGPIAASATGPVQQVLQDSQAQVLQTGNPVNTRAAWGSATGQPVRTGNNSVLLAVGGVAGLLLVAGLGIGGVMMSRHNKAAAAAQPDTAVVTPTTAEPTPVPPPPPAEPKAEATPSVQPPEPSAKVPETPVKTAVASRKSTTSAKGTKPETKPVEAKPAETKPDPLGVR
jgi:eukaryotic-like serine/threonine-protein kinase